MNTVPTVGLSLGAYLGVTFVTNTAAMRDCHPSRGPHGVTRHFLVQAYLTV